MLDNANKLGYQGSEKSRGELIIYPQGRDPIIINSPNSIEFTGKQIWDSAHGLVSIQTNKVLGQCSGTWSAVIKYSKAIDDLFKMVVDDDWVDINFYRHGKKWHVMRGLVSDIRYHQAVSANGATVRNFVISGSDWMSIFERTPIWFSPYTDDEVSGGVAYNAFTGVDSLVGSPVDAVRGFLFAFLRVFKGMGRATWLLPLEMPKGKIPSAVDPTFNMNVFSDSVLANFNYFDFTNNPPRLGLNVDYMELSGNLWQLAQEWSDPAFCELFGDTVLPLQDQINMESSPDQTVMQVTFRDRPFLAVTPQTAFPVGMASSYFSLPMHTINQQDVVGMDIGRAGSERFNTFLLSPQTTQEMAAASVDMAGPLWNTDDIKYHGLRRFDIVSHYVVEDPTLINLTQGQRYLLQDWHCMNPYLLSGNIYLGRGFPEIHIGEKVSLLGKDPTLDKTFYVESVSHNWQFGSTTKTTLGVTRGWEGTAADYIAALTDVSFRYNLATKGNPGVPPVAIV